MNQMNRLASDTYVTYDMLRMICIKVSARDSRAQKACAKTKIVLFSKMKLHMKFLIIRIILKYYLEKSRISKQL